MSDREIDDSFHSAGDKYVQYNFHRQDHIDKMLQVLQDEEGELPRVVILAGEQGIGRSYFIESVAHIAGKKIHVCKLDLDGFADENTSLEEYVNHQIAKASESDRPKLIEMIKALQPELKIKAGFWSCAFLSAALSLKVLLGWPRRKTNIDLSGPDRPPRERFSRLLSSLTKNSKLILHVTDNELLTLTFRRWLLAELNTHKNLTLAFSCDYRNSAETDFQDIEALRLEFAPYDKKSCRSVSEERFEPTSFPDAFYAVIWRYSHGVPRDMARVFMDLVREKQVRWTGDSWCVTDDNLTSEDFVRIFEARFYEPFDALSEELPAEQMDHLETFMRLAVMCGKYVPANLILKHMGLSLEERDSVCDLIDERLIEKTDDPIFEDYEASHPSFKGITIYGFKNRTLREVFLQQLSSKEQSELASNLINYLKVNLPIKSRGIAKLFIELSSFLQRQDDVEFYRNHLAWWVGIDEAEELSRNLTNASKNRQINPGALWQVVTSTKNIWPPYRILAVLDAYAKQPGGVPFDKFDTFHNRKGVLLIETGKFHEAEEIFRILLKRSEDSLGREHLNTTESLNNLAATLHKQGKYEEANHFLRRTLEIHKNVLGPDHPKTAQSLHNLATTLAEQGKYDEAIRLLQRALEIHEILHGPDHLNTAWSLESLAGVLGDQGKYDEANHLLRRALEIRERVLGPNHPNTATSLDNLAKTLAHQGKYIEAETLQRRALDIFVRAFRPGHPGIVETLENLAETLDHQSKNVEARAFRKKAEDIRAKGKKQNPPTERN
jgi:tetratricopeptide (TPR) repeat protein